MMLKKIVGITLLAGFASVLIFGAVNRTLAKDGEHEARALTVQSSGGHPVPESNLNGYAAQSGEGYRGGQNSGTGQYGNGNQGEAREDQQNIPNPQAQVDEWVTVEGEVNSVDSTLAIVTLADGKTVEITGRPWSFAQENGYALEIGDRVQLTGFYEDTDRFEIGAIENLTRGTSLQIRDQTGRPLWAGRGRQG